MTAIVGYWDGGAAYLAADGRASWGDSVPNDSTLKLIRNAEWMIGYAGSARGVHILKRVDLPSVISIEEVADALREVFKSDEWNNMSEQGRPPKYQTSILVASRDGLWVVCSEFSPMMIKASWTIGVGSGGDFAAGASQALIEQGESPLEALSRGITIASTKDQYTGGRIYSWNSIDYAIRVKEG